MDDTPVAEFASVVAYTQLTKTDLVVISQLNLAIPLCIRQKLRQKNRHAKSPYLWSAKANCQLKKRRSAPAALWALKLGKKLYVYVVYKEHKIN